MSDNLAPASCGDDRMQFFSKVVKGMEIPDWDDCVRMFLEQAAKGAVGRGSFDDWPQLRKSCGSALARISQLETQAAEMEAALRNAVQVIEQIMPDSPSVADILLIQSRAILAKLDAGRGGGK